MKSALMKYKGVAATFLNRKSSGFFMQVAINISTTIEKGHALEKEVFQSYGFGKKCSIFSFFRVLVHFRS